MSTLNIVLGAGRVYFDLKDSAGNLTGERYLAETPDFSMTVDSEKLEEYSSDGPTAEKLLDITKSVNRKAACTVKDISGENLAMFILGDVSSLSTAAGSAVNDPVNGANPVLADRWYQLGVAPGYPAGLRGLTNVEIRDAGTPLAVGQDYALDAETGRIHILPGGAAAGKVLTADFDTQVVSWENITSNDLGAKTGALRWVADNTSGENRDAYFPDVVMSPAGDFQWKSRDTVQSMGFEIGVQKPSDGRAAVYINGRPT